MVRAGVSSVEASTVDIGRDRRVDAILEPLTAAHGTANLRGRNALAHARQQMQRRTVTDSLGQRGQRESGAVRHDEFHLVREDVRAAPRRDVEERVSTDQKEQPVARAEGAPEPADRVDRVRGAGDEIRVLQPRGHERALTCSREDDHGMTVVERRDSAGALVRGDTRRNEQEFLEHELTPSGAGDGEVPAVDRIERAAEEGDVHGRAWMAASTLVGVNGTHRSRTPIASKTALAMAAGTAAAAWLPRAPRPFPRPRTDFRPQAVSPR